MHPTAFITRLQELVHRERSLHVELLAERMAVTRQTVWGWINGKWKIPLDGAQKLVGYAQDGQLGKAFAAGTGLRIVPAVYVEQPNDIFFLIANHAHAYARLLQISMSLKNGSLSLTERTEALTMLQHFDAFSQQISVQLAGLTV